ncbi:MAG: tyrosine--tRNA ligase [Chloroflexi bacterium]|nr:tyrosine--tRNA ligase [Chloroflexota bacterium]
MRFSLSPGLLHRQPDLLVGLVAVWGADNAGHRAEVAQALQRVSEELRTRLGTRPLEQEPAIAAWREAFQRAGISPRRHVPSVEALATRALRGRPVPTVNPAADVANLVALTYLVPVGAHDLERLPGDIEVRLSRPGDWFTPMDSEVREEVPAGEPVYATGNEVRTRRWVWRQGEKSKVTPESRTLLFPVDGFTDATGDAVRQATLALADLARRHLGGQTAVAFVDAQTPSVELVPGLRPAEIEATLRPAVLPLPTLLEAATSPAMHPSPAAETSLRRWPFEALKRRGLIEGVIVEEELLRDLSAGKRLTIYQGFDPTSPNLHLGHYLSLRVLRWFQSHGHRVIFLVGDFTGRIGDPTDRTAARQQLTHEQVLRNAETYTEQIAHVLDLASDNPVEVVFNGAWLDPLTLRDVVHLAASVTVQRLLERDMFQERMREGKPLHLHEVLYPLFQGYDSVAMAVDAELGGRDQMFNMMVGRDLVRTYLGKTKHVLMTPLIPGLDGRKMSKSYGNTVDLTEGAVPMFFKLTLVDDRLLPLFLGVFTDAPDAEIAAVRERLGRETNLQDVRERFAREVTATFHGEEAAARAQEEFRQVVSEGALPAEVLTIEILAASAEAGAVSLLEAVMATGLAASRSDARRLIQQGGVRLNGERLEDPGQALPWSRVTGAILKVGRRGYVRLLARAGE